MDGSLKPWFRSTSNDDYLDTVPATSATSNILEGVEAMTTWLTMSGETLNDGVTDGAGDVSQGGGNCSQKDNCDYFQYVCFVIVAAFIGMVGLLGNTLAATLLWKERKKSATVFLLICLTFVDDLVILSWLLISSVPTYVSYTKRYLEFLKIFPVIQAYVYPFCTLILMVTTYLTVMVTSQRYVAVCHPYHVQKYGTLKIAKLQFVGTVAFCLIFNIPRFMEYRVNKRDTGKLYRFVTDLSKSETYETVYKVSLYYVFSYILPLIMLVYMTVRLTKALRENRKRTQEMTSQNSPKEDLTVILVAVVAIFVICQLFNPVRRVWEAMTEPEDRECGSRYFYFSPLVLLAVVFNSSINFVVYVICGRRFRRRLLNMFRLRRRRQVGPFVVASASNSLPQNTSGARGGQNKISPFVSKGTTRSQVAY